MWPLTSTVNFLFFTIRPTLSNIGLNLSWIAALPEWKAIKSFTRRINPSGAGSASTIPDWISFSNSCVISCWNLASRGIVLKSSAITCSPSGEWGMNSFFCTPNASFMEPEICLNLMASITEKESNSTKKQRRSDIRSANVHIHNGAPFLHFSCFISSSMTDWSHLVTVHRCLICVPWSA